MKERYGGKIIKFVSVALVAFVVFFQLYQSFYNPITTGTAVYYDAFNGIDIKTVAIRDESLLKAKDDGVLSFCVDDGGKIEKGGTVANIYKSESDANVETEIENLEKAIEDLEEVNGYNTTDAVDIDYLDSKIDTALKEIINETASGTIDSGSAAAAELLKLINRRQIVTGKSSGFDSLLTGYKQQLEQLKDRKSGVYSKVKSKKSGYFVSGVDGYESVLNSDKIDEITPEMLNNMQPEMPSDDKKLVGKIVSDYEWYLAATLSMNDSLKFTEDAEIILKTNFESMPELPVKVARVNRETGDDTAVVFFLCTYMNSDLATMRTQDMTAVLENYTGLQVNSKAVRFVDGKKGVYVVSGSVISFVPVNVLYSTDGYCICEVQTTGVRLKLYDEIVIKGKNLYDGKVINRTS